MKRLSNILGSKKGATTSPPASSNPGGNGILDRWRRDSSTPDDGTTRGGDTPEANAARGVRLFCESGGPGNAGEEVLHLPGLVEAAESSPAAAGAAAKEIRKLLGRENYSNPHVQYNAVMLIRILVDNPGPTFTRHVDSKFVSAVKELLRHGRDASVQQILRETLQALYHEKAYDSNLQQLSQMWNKEQIAMGQRRPPPPQLGTWGGRTPDMQQPSSGGLGAGWQPKNNAIPAPAELSARIEEAKTSAKLLQQFVQSTAPQDVQNNELVKEFAERCQAAQRSMQAYINCDNPPPDDDTMQTLIETSEQLSLAASKHGRAILQARRAAPSQDRSPPQDTNTSESTTPVASATFVPSGRPPTLPVAPPLSPTTVTPVSPPPAPPPTLRTNLERRNSQERDVPTTHPSVLRPGPRSGLPGNTAAVQPTSNIQELESVEAPAAGSDDPFTDEHSHVEDDEYDHDDLYNESPTVASRAPSIPQYARGYMASSAHDPDLQYAPPRDQSPPRPGVHQQDSWSQSIPPGDDQFAPGTVGERPDMTSKNALPLRAGSYGEVSPVESRTSAGYRYGRN